jgi:hypothetical protein
MVLILVALMSVSHNSPVSPLLIARRKPLFQVFLGTFIDISNTATSNTNISNAAFQTLHFKVRTVQAQGLSDAEHPQCGIVSGRLSGVRLQIAPCDLPA